jgi:hypothetical protein
VESLQFVHCSQFVGQSYVEGVPYRNVSWVFGNNFTDNVLLANHGGNARYIIKIPRRELLNSVIDLRNGTIAMSPQQVLNFVKYEHVAP